MMAMGVLAAACGNSDDTSSQSPGTVPTTDAVATPATVAASTVPPSADVETTPAEPLPVVVATYSVLAAVVEPLLAGVADLRVVIPNGQDPHDFAPSAKDVELMGSASLILANGLDLEEGLVDVIARVEADGVPVFRVTDHVTLLELGTDSGSDDGHGHGDEHGDEHGGEDPHVWTDPATMVQMIPALGEALGEALGVNLTDQAAAAAEGLLGVDAEAQAIMGTVADCTLVTGHDSMQYFAQRYGCEVIGAVIPGLSTGSEPSAGEVSALRSVAQQAGVAAIFTELGIPQRVAEQVAREVGVPLVELSTHVVPDGGGYRQFVLSLAVEIAEALS
jgi:zinc/manganese transport system substrate-binding protein